MTNLADIQQIELAKLVPTYERFPVMFERGEGVYLFDSKGKRYLDFLSGIGVNALGYAHPAVTQTITEQAAKLVHTSNLFFHPYQAKLAAKLTKLAGLDRAFFSNSGTEAWEGALKLARAYAKHSKAKGKRAKTKFLMMDNSFHGRTYGSLATTGQKKYRAPFAPGLPGVEFVKFNDVEDLKAKFNDSVCAIGLEVVQGEGGIRPVSPEFLAAARELTAQSGALLIVDEIQSGLGRTGKWFAYQHYGIQPDIVTVAKPIANGLPLGAFLTTDAVAAAFHPGMHGTTYGGGPLSCAVALTVLCTMEQQHLLENASKVGAYFQQSLHALKAECSHIAEVRGLGLMVCAQLDSADLAKAAVKQMLDKGIIINRTNDNVLRFLPPYLVGTEHVDEVVSALAEVLGVKKPEPELAAVGGEN